MQRLSQQKQAVLILQKKVPPRYHHRAKLHGFRHISTENLYMLHTNNMIGNMDPSHTVRDTPFNPLSS